MHKASENTKTNAVWFGLVDFLILLIVGGIISSLFLVEKTAGLDRDDPNAEILAFSVEVKSPYDEALFRQEGNGEPITLSLDGAAEPFGKMYLGEDGLFYVECQLSAVRASEDEDGLWYLGKNILMSGTTLSVKSALSDFSVTVVSSPVRVSPGTLGTTVAETDPPKTPQDSPENDSSNGTGNFDGEAELVPDDAEASASDTSDVNAIDPEQDIPENSVAA